MNPSALPISAPEITRAEVFTSSLHPHVLGLAGTSEAVGWRLIYVEQGRAELLDGAETFPLIAPCVTWQPWNKGLRARLGAGAVGMHALIGAGVLANAIGHKPESPELWFMTDRRAHVSLADNSRLARDISQSMATIVEETGQDRAAVRTIVEAALRIILINIWRAQAAQQDGARTGSSTQRFLGQFNNLIEVHFRERWSIGRYASALGITTDRLNDICKRGRGRTPRQMIASRVGVEARLLLESSFHSLDQIASQLGFPSTAQFNRFFKSVHDIPPGQYRRQQLGRPAQQSDAGPGTLFEWP